MAPGCLCGPVSLTHSRCLSICLSLSCVRLTIRPLWTSAFLGVCVSHQATMSSPNSMSPRISFSKWLPGNAPHQTSSAGSVRFSVDPQLPPKKWSYFPLNLRFSAASLPSPVYVIQHLPWDIEELTTCCLGFFFWKYSETDRAGEKINKSAILAVVMSVWEMNKAGCQGRLRVFKLFSAGCLAWQARCLPSITASEARSVPASYGPCLCSSPSAVTLCCLF